MGLLTIPGGQEALENPDKFKLLPIEHQVGEQMVKKEYLAEIQVAKQINDRNGKPMLSISMSVDHNGNRYYLNDLFSYMPSFLARLSNFVKLLGINPKDISEESFVGRFVWVTIRHEQYDSKTMKNSDGSPMSIVDNRVEAYVRAATPEEVSGSQPAAPAGQDGDPF